MLTIPPPRAVDHGGPDDDAPHLLFHRVQDDSLDSGAPGDNRRRYQAHHLARDPAARISHHPHAARIEKRLPDPSSAPTIAATAA
ncbi:MAG: hypothetical protein IPM24_25250 [Bryobacterales bacterium]|nr:hypothetical protein [Bryobacterales bacterium]